MYVIKHWTILTLNPEILFKAQPTLSFLLSIQQLFSIISSAKIKQLIENILIFNCQLNTQYVPYYGNGVLYEMWLCV